MPTHSLIFGAQYYRAPTPLRSDWARDLDQFAAAGFNTVKLWAQWRWNNPRPGELDFTDLDELMDLAAERGLQVIINVILDVAPAWFWLQHPEARMLTADGRLLGPTALPHRSIGGAPGPCLNHPEGQSARFDFLSGLVRRYATHRALLMWDLWNEPELTCGIATDPRPENLVCYCELCRTRFVLWLQERHTTLGALNRCWQRNYRSWDEVEPPLAPGGLVDMIEWRLYFADVLAGDLHRRVEIARALDRQHPLMCHTVPSPIFNPATHASDEWLLSEPCDVMGTSGMGQPLATDISASAADGRMVIQAELHALPGSLFNRPQPVAIEALRRQILVPLGRGSKGFLFWQYRPERHGSESPAWGLTLPDGSPAPWHADAAALNGALQREARFWRHAQPSGPQVGIVISPANALFNWCGSGSFALHDRALAALHGALNAAQWRIRLLHPRDLARGAHHDLRVIFCPLLYLLDAPSAEALRSWTLAGGTLVGEAFMGAYAPETNLHEPHAPGRGLDELFGVREGPARPASEPLLTGCTAPPLPLIGQATGAAYAVPLELRGATPLATWDDGSVALACRPAGKGHAIYAGTWLSLAAAAHGSPASGWVQQLATFGEGQPRPAAIAQPATATDAVRIDWLAHEDQHALLAHNLTDRALRVQLTLPVEAPASAALEEIMCPTARIAPAPDGGWVIDLPPSASRAYRLRM